MGKPGRGVLSVSVRAALALGVIVGQYLLALAVLAVLVVVDVFLIRSGQVFTFNVLEGLVGSVAIAWVVVRSVFLVRRAERADQPAALPLTSAEQPGLWRRVREIAEQVGTRPPTELFLIADASALVQHSGRIWGLVPGERRLYIGAPLLIGLSAGELDAVLAHELGHYANGDVRLEALVWAARDRLLRTVLALSGNSAKGGKGGKGGKGIKTSTAETASTTSAKGGKNGKGTTTSTSETASTTSLKAVGGGKAVSSVAKGGKKGSKTTSAAVVVSTTIVKKVTVIESFFEFTFGLGGLPPSVSKKGNQFFVLEQIFEDITLACGAACEEQFTSCTALEGPGFSFEECSTQKESCGSAASSQSSSAAAATITATVTVPPTVSFLTPSMKNH